MADDDRSDEVDGSTSPETAPRPRPSTAAEERSESTQPGEPKGPVSAASRARRIGGRPVVPAAAAQVDLAKPRPTPASPGAGRPSAAPQAANTQLPKTEPPKTPKNPRVNAGVIGNPAWIPAFVLGTAALVMLILIAVAAHGVYYAKSGVSAATRNSAQQAALAAAKSCIATINTYDYRTLPKNEAAALACITGSFTNSMKTTYTKTLIPEAPIAKATQTAQITYAGIRSISGDGKQIDILLYGQLVETNVSTASAGTPRYAPVGVLATMDRVGTQWLVAKYGSDTGAGS